MTGRLPRGMVWLRQFAATQRELEERRRLLDRPWEEDLLHWHRDADGTLTLHGEVPPPRDGRRSTTPEGWCPVPYRAPAAPRNPDGPSHHSMPRCPS